MDDLPELPFEKVLSYLSLKDRLKARAVSRRWYNTINRFKVKTLCYSKHPSDFTFGKGRWISGAYAQNFIWSTRFESFFNTFSATILSNLKHLRICNLRLNEASTFIPTLNLFDRLEELDLIRFTHPSAASGLGGEVELTLPMLTSIHLEWVERIDQLTLNAPRLKRVKLLGCSSSLRLKLVYADSVEWLATRSFSHVEAKNLKSLKYLHCGYVSEIDATFLSGLQQLKELHTRNPVHASSLFEQKQRYGRTDLKIFLGGLLLNGPDDPAIVSLSDLRMPFFRLAENPSRLADEIPLWTRLFYTSFDGITPESVTNILNRFTYLSMIVIESSIPAQDVQRFLDTLKNFPNIVSLHFSGDQPQNLFDRLPEHSAVQYLTIQRPVSDFRFLYRLEHLLIFQYRDQIAAEVVRKAFEGLPFFWILVFTYLNQKTKIGKWSPNRWSVSIGEKKWLVTNLNSVIELVFGQIPQKKRKAEELLE